NALAFVSGVFRCLSGLAQVCFMLGQVWTQVGAHALDLNMLQPGSICHYNYWEVFKIEKCEASSPHHTADAHVIEAIDMVAIA
ncbi:hypothetical protein PJI17_32185, partial [Mycobacterium kansasii]